MSRSRSLSVAPFNRSSLPAPNVFTASTWFDEPFYDEATMDQDEELAKFKWILIVGIALIMTGCYSLNELRYAVWGKSVEAKLTGAKEVTKQGRRGRTSTVLRVEYQFSEAGGASRSENDEVSTDWTLPSNGSVPVQYIPSVEHASRLQGHSNMLAVYLFLACIVGAVYAIYKVSLYVNDDGSSSKKKRRRN